MLWRAAAGKLTADVLWHADTGEMEVVVGADSITLRECFRARHEPRFRIDADDLARAQHIAERLAQRLEEAADGTLTPSS